MRSRVWSFFGALAAAGMAFLLLEMRFESIDTRSAPAWVTRVWFTGLLVSMVAFIMLVGHAFVGFDDRPFPQLGTARAPTGRQLLLTYWGLLSIAGLLALVHVVVPSTSPVAVSLSFSGIVLIAASSGRPWWLFATLRRMRAAADIANDTAVRWFLGVGGALLLAAGLWQLTR